MKAALVAHGPLALFKDLRPSVESFRDAVLSGLSQPQKRLSSSFFYDARGSELFERICETPEYYVTRTELALLERRAEEIAALLGPGCQIIEYGSGAARKVGILLRALRKPVGYVAIDIAREALVKGALAVAEAHPGLEVVALRADYRQPLEIPQPARRSAERRILFFPGSTIGNFTPGEAARFLHAAAESLLPGDGFLIGVDLKKDPALLHAAYNDAAGVTAAFNLNLLARVNRELGGDFDLSGFAHRAFYDAGEGRIEMHLESRRRQRVRVAGRSFAFSPGETIHTENSYKYHVEEFRRLAARAGWHPTRTWTDAGRLFSLHLFELP